MILYKYVGAMLSDDEVIIFKNNNDIIEESVSKVVLIHDLKEGISLPFNKCILKLDQLELFENSIVDLYTKETFKNLIGFGLISHQYEEDEHTRNWLLSHLIQYEKDLPWDLLDYVYESNKGYNIEGWLTLVNNLKIAQYLRMNGASLKPTAGYGDPKQIWEEEGRQDLLDFFYNNPLPTCMTDEWMYNKKPIEFGKNYVPGINC